METSQASAQPFSNQGYFTEIRRRLGAGQHVSDSEFDAIFPPPIRAKSEIHWTPVAVAQRAARMLMADKHSRILDVGSGPGKFCLVGAMSSAGTYVGVEQRPHLSDFARTFALTHQLERVSFLNAGIEQIDWSPFSGIYLYNPFIETLYHPPDRIDDSIESGQERYLRLVRFVQLKLSRLRVGTRVVTFHGFGGDLPPSYDMVVQERWGEDYLICWEKRL
jgi:hypothetical protein